MNKNFLSSPRRALRPGALTVASSYLILGILWILFSDRFAVAIALDKEILAAISLYKGWGFVIVTAGLLYWLIQRSTATLRASEEQLQRVIDAMPAFIAYVDADLRYRFANLAYKQRFGASLEGKHIQEVLGKAAYAVVSKHVEKVFTGETTSYQTGLPYRDRELFITATYVPDLGRDGKVRGFFVLAQDHTGQKQAEEEKRLWADAFEGCAHGIAIGDPNTNRILACNPAFAAMHKSRVEDIVGTAILGLYSPADHEQVRRNIQKADQIGHVSFEASMMSRGGDGSTFAVETDVVSVLGDEGELLHRVVTAQDISERIQSEKTLRESEERYRIVSELTSDYAYRDRVEADGSIVPEWFTDSFTRITGYTLEDTRAPGFWQQLVHPEDQSLLVEHIQKVLSGESDSKELRVITRDGEMRWLRDYANPVWDADEQRVTHMFGAVQDVTDYRGAEEKIRQQARLLEEVNDAVLATDSHFILTSWNPAAERIFGWKAEEVIGKRAQDVLQTRFMNKTREEVLQEFAETGKFASEVVQICKDGSSVQIDARTAATHDASGNINGYVSVNRDVTERKRVEADLRLKDDLLRLTSQMAKVGGWEFDPVTGRGTWTDEVARIHDLEPGQEIDVTTGLRFYEGEAREKIERAIRDAVEQARPYDLELEMVTGKGNHKWIRTMGLPILQDGQVVKLQGIFQDITERKEIEKALQAARADLANKVQERTAALSQANALLQALMDNIPDHIYFKDRQSRFIRNSRSQAHLLGLPEPADATGKTDFDFFAHASRSYADEQEVMRTGEPLVDIEEWVVWPGGREMCVSTTKMPLRDAEGNIIGIFGISHDITERKRAEQAIQELNRDLQKQTEQLQAANRELEAFSYSVSHDLRAPLRAIDGYTRILVEDYGAALDDEGRRICSVVSKEARRMGQLIDDLLSFSRLGRKEIYVSRIDMKRLASTVLTELLKEEPREHLQIDVADLPEAFGDSSLMRQVWVNLISNALKFTSRREQAVIQIGSQSSEEKIVYYVRDNGAGFDMEYAGKLFGVFQRLHTESEFGGTGVGLAIVQRIIQRHGGHVWADGEVEKGATFYFSLPRKDGAT